MKKMFLSIVFDLVLLVVAFCQNIPPPLNLGIRNVLQETPVWCWVAVSQEIIEYTNGSSPSQLELAALALNIPINQAQQNPQLCVRTESLQQIQFLISPGVIPRSLLRRLQ
jgi:hypothetical protein